MKIAVIGIGYVGLANAILLARQNEVVAVDIDKEKVDLINQMPSPIVEKDMKEFFPSESLNLRATNNAAEAIQDADFVIVATPTNFNEQLNSFDVHAIEKIIRKAITINPSAGIIIKSTVPIGFTASLRKKLNTENILFCPEFLREGRALYDNLYPSRIVVGDTSDKAKKFANLLVEGALKTDIKVLLTNSTEAEAIKLFSNTYLAMRVAFFNELDTFAEAKGLHTKQIIDGIGLDPRIGNYYNNPSFGYGGYCLPKDTKQLLSNYQHLPHPLMSAIVDSNASRKTYITNAISQYNPKTVGIYRLTMKTDADNYRESAIIDVMYQLQEKGIHIIIYEPTLTEFMQFKIENSLNKFKALSDVIVANRISSDLEDVKEKVYSRDLYNRD